MKPHSKQQGYILLPVVLIITLVAIVAFMMNVESTLETGATSGERQTNKARYVAEAGLNHAGWQVGQAGCGPYTDITGEVFGDNSYSASITPNQVGGAITTYTVPVSDDAYIKQDTPIQNYGNDTQLPVYAFFSDIRRAIYRFDIENSGIPNGTTILSATLKLFVIDPHTMGAVNIYRVTEDWNENTVTWDSIAVHHDPSVLAAIPQGPMAGEYIDINLTALVQGWVNGSIANQGIMLRTTVLFDLSQFTSKEYGNATQRPLLEVKTTDGSLSTRADISATGILANGMEQTLTREKVVLYQPPSSLAWQHDASLGVDAEVWDQQPNNNYGGENVTWVSSASGDKTRSLLRFDMGAIPAGARILEATLSLYRKSGSGSDQPVSAHHIMNSWSEDSVTWRSRESGTLWDTAGVDFDLTAVATTPVGPDNRPYEWNITPLVQGWVDGSYPNYGVVLAAAIDGMPGEEFFTSDHTDPTQRPNLNITYACECGTACLAPQGTGNILVVVGNPGSLTPGEDILLRLFQVWGYGYSLIQDDDSQGNFDAGMVANDVVFVSESVAAGNVGTKLTNAGIGVLNAQHALNDELGISTDGATVVGQTILVTDTSHEITSVFPAGTLQFKLADMAMNTEGGTLAPGAQVLAEFGGAGALVVLDSGAELAGGGNAAGRRVLLPLGGADFNPYLTNNGQLIVQRAIEWAKPISCSDGDYRDNFDSEAFSNNDGTLTWGSDWTEVDGDGAGPASGNVIIRSGLLVLDDNPNTGGQPSAARTLNLLGASMALLDFDFELGKRTDSSSDVAILEITTDGITWDVLENFSVFGGGDSGHRSYNLSGYLTADIQIRFRIQANYTDNDENLQIDNLVVSVCGTVSQPVSTGPVAHWPLDETSGPTAEDIEGGHDGDLIDGPVWTPGQIDGGLSFDGSDDYINVPHQDTLSMKNFTISAWVRPAALNGYRIVVSKGTAADLNYYLGTHDNEITFGFLNVGAWREFETSGAGLAINNWYLLAGTFDDTIGEAKMYLNGVLLHTATTTASPPACNDDLMIGTTIFDEFWSGLLDDVRIYNRVLGGSEVADLHAGGSPPAPEIEYLDQFNATAYNGSDGTMDWSSSPWTEANDDGAPDTGNIRVRSGLLVLNNLDGVDLEGLVRNADLSVGGAAAAVLSFDYGGRGEVSSDDSFWLAVSDDGGSSWVGLEKISVAGDVSGSRSYNLHDSIALTTNFRLRVQILSGLDGVGQYFYLDNVTIDLDAGGAGGGCNGSYADAFNRRIFSGSDGSLAWTGDWSEVGESDGPTAGDIGVGNDMSDFQLRLQDNDNGGEGVSRGVDLSGATSAQLSFIYRRVGLDRASDYVYVAISTTGPGGPWTEIARLEGPANDATYQPFSIDISSHISATTHIGFRTSPTMGDIDRVWIDDIEISCSP